MDDWLCLLLVLIDEASMPGDSSEASVCAKKLPGYVAIGSVFMDTVVFASNNKGYEQESEPSLARLNILRRALARRNRSFANACLNAIFTLFFHGSSSLRSSQEPSTLALLNKQED